VSVFGLFGIMYVVGVIREPVSLPRVRYADCGAFPTFYITLYDFIFRYIEKVFYISSYIGIYNQICGSPASAKQLK
jgi:hypothetical protein